METPPICRIIYAPYRRYAAAQGRNSRVNEKGIQIRPLSSIQQAGNPTSYPHIIHPVCSSIIHISFQVLRIYPLLQNPSISQDVSVSKSHPAAQEPNAASLRLRGYIRSRSSRRPCLHHISLSPSLPSSFRSFRFSFKSRGRQPFPFPLPPSHTLFSQTRRRWSWRRLRCL